MEGINHEVKAMPPPHYGLRDERLFILRLFGLHEAIFKLSGCSGLSAQRGHFPGKPVFFFA